MARFFITGSSDGLGALTAKRLISQGHTVVLHARNPQRAQDAEAACPGAAGVVIGDLSSPDETKQVAAQADTLGPYAGIVHNAGVYQGTERVSGTSDLPTLFAVNVLAPYVLTCRMQRPARTLLYVSSGTHYSGRARLESEESLLGSGYADSKLHVVMLAKAFARRWQGVASNAADPGWVPTKMGGRSAPGSVEDGVSTFVMAALGEGAAAGKTGRYFAASQEKEVNKEAEDVAMQDKLLMELERISGVSLPE